MQLIFLTTLVTISVYFGVSATFFHNIGESIQIDNKYEEIHGKTSNEIDKELAHDVFNQAFEFNKVPNARLPEIVNQCGYPLESYYITTKDGYILNIFRMPYGKNGKREGKVILLSHGIFLAATDFVIFGPQQGLAYILADNGYDVWMMNFRGNIYSRNHTTFDPDKDKEFWMYSWHEMGIYDTPTTIDFILEKTGNKTLYHIAHSEGSTAFYVMASLKPEYNHKIKHHISLGPIAFMEHLHSPIIKLLSSTIVRAGMKQLDKYEFGHSEGLISDIISVMCSESIGTVLCKNFIFLLAGYSPQQVNASAIPLIAGHYPAGASTRQVLHYCQENKSGKFAQFDFGLMKNLMIYLRATPPDYDLSEISTPISLIYSSNDWLAATVDVDKLAERLPNLQIKYLVPIPTWNHLDFVFGNDVPSVIYTKILEILSTF
ncbi:lipase 3-like [Diorhabda sublineata]|uniref:lipase 3-like n=1 Tax=Diorhabda sublineata TaxID=1163346 RepID=UPI0024E120A6|nr:lipase 3-like [Diorhabda sublineata]